MAKKNLVTTYITLRVHHDPKKISPQQLADTIGNRTHTIEGVEDKEEKPNTDGKSVDVRVL